MKIKEYHHFQFIDPTSGNAPLSVTMLIRYDNLSHEKKVPISTNELIDLNDYIFRTNGDINKLFRIKTKIK